MNLVNKIMLSFTFFVGLSINIFSQSNHITTATPFCGLSTVPMPSEDAKAYIEAMHNESRKQLQDSIIFPIVIHNLTWNNRGYVQNEKLLEWVEKTNDALANRGAFYDPEGVDTRFRLCLAGKDPKGNPTSGIIHKEDVYCMHREIYFDNPQLYDTWDNSKYINIFVMEGLSGAARYPWNVKFDGLTVSSKTVETTEGVRIMCHELGHYFGLLHTFEGCRNDGCFEHGDMVCDTRPEQLSFTRCQDYNSCFTDAYAEDPDNPFSEDDVDMDENYMDGGLCRTRFTAGQVVRMQWALDKYRMPDLDSLAVESLCSTCSSLLSDIAIENSTGLVGEAIEIRSTDDLEEIEYNWYVDNIWQSSEHSFSYKADTPGVRRIQLTLNNKLNPNCSGSWTTEKSIAFVCDTIGKSFLIPDEILKDSCYIIQANGFESLEWSFTDQSGTGSFIEICPNAIGPTSLLLSYGQGACVFRDSVTLHVRSAEDNHIRKYYQQEFTDSVEYRTSLRIAKMERLANEITVMFGEKYSTGESVDFWSADTSENFIAYWDDQSGFVEKWELYHADTFSQELVSDFPLETSMQIHPKDWYIDSIGNIYFLANEQYARSSDLRGMLVGKINQLGRLEWSKRIYTPSIWSDTGVNRTPAYIHLTKGLVTIAFHQVILQLDIFGKFIQAKNLKVLPIEMHHEGIRSSTVEFILNDSLIVAYGSHARIEKSEYEAGSDDLFTPLRSKKYMAKIDLNSGTDVLSSFDFSNVFGRTIRTVVHPKGYLSYWFAYHPDETTTSSNSNDFYQHHLALFDNQGEVLWKKTYKDTDQRSRRDHETNLHLLKNGEFIIINGNEIFFESNDNAFHGANDYLRFDADGNLVESRKYQPAGKKRPIGGPNLWINQPSTLANDGILVATHRRDSLLGRVFLQSIPLDNEHLSCLTSDSIFVEVESPPLALDIEPIGMVLLDTEVRLEDVELHIRKSTTRTQAICDSTHLVEDYYFGKIDTTCISNSEMKLNVEICRELGNKKDTVLLNLYDMSPLSTSIFPSIIENGYFEVDELCKELTFTIPRQDYHLMLNSKPDYNSPFTLESTFFDAAENLEYDYSNNYATIIACDYSVSVTSFTSVSELVISPNPANQTINLSCGDRKIIEFSVFSVLGNELIFREVNKYNPQINISSLMSGTYIVVVHLENGYQQAARMVKH